MEDAADLKSAILTGVWVRVPPSAPFPQIGTISSIDTIPPCPVQTSLLLCMIDGYRLVAKEVFMPKLGLWELAIILLIILLIFGAGRLPQIGSSLGRSMRSFKNAITGQDEAETQDARSKRVKSGVKDEENS